MRECGGYSDLFWTAELCQIEAKPGYFEINIIQHAPEVVLLDQSISYVMIRVSVYVFILLVWGANCSMLRS